MTTVRRMPGASAAPRVWVLLGKGVGGNRQMQALADALGWPYETKRLFHNAWNRCPNLLLGASALSVDRRRSDALEPPWPDLVIGASRRSAPIARWIQAQSGGRARLVHLMHTQAPLDRFDIVITTPQYRLPRRPNVLHMAGPLLRMDPDRLAAAAAAWAPRLEHLPRPRTALLVGGNSSSYRLDAPRAVELGRRASAHARAAAGSLLVSTSARTPPDAADALVEAIDCPHFLYRWRPDAGEENPYLGYLALADGFIVTVDSASLLAEACTSGRPVQIFEWPRRPVPLLSAKGLLERWVGSGASAENGGGLFARLVYWGLVKPPRDFGAYTRGLVERGLVSPLGAAREGGRRRPLDDMDRAVRRIRELMGREDGSPDEAVS
jgi:hypothetical protein